MGSFSGLGIGLSFVFGCILMGLVAELYYLLWVKRRMKNRESEGDQEESKVVSEFGYLFCWKKPMVSAGSERNQESNGQSKDLELGGGKDSLLKGFGEEGVESELMRLHNLCGPPRFLFTIKEETKEDLESEDGKSKGGRSRKSSRTRSLSDLIMAADTPLLCSPMASPPSKALPLDSYNHHGFNPLFESSTDAELNRLRSSPPPNFKFLRDAEEKLIRRLVEEAERTALKNNNGGSVHDLPVKPTSNPTEEKIGSFMSFLVRSKERELQNQLPIHHSAPSKVLPLASSPSAFRA